MKLDHDFIWDALERLAKLPQRRKVWLRWNDEDHDAHQYQPAGGGRR